ncbi:hypothetical protein LEMLEM_LOCUS8849, partial [Lemmus lemmus]
KLAEARAETEPLAHSSSDKRSENTTLVYSHSLDNGILVSSRLQTLWWHIWTKPTAGDTVSL